MLRKLYVTSVVLFGLFGILACGYAYIMVQLPSVVELTLINPPTTAYIDYFEDRHPDVAIKHTWVDLDEISPNLLRAVIVGEDERFFEHEGFDWQAIKKAIEYNKKKKKWARGASTITQQLARNLYLSPSKNIFRKGVEFLIALKLETFLTKERILELYVNVAQWGYGIYGVEAASKHYFHKSAKSLTREQAAFLASILPSPVKWGGAGYHLTPRARRILSGI